MTKLLKLSCAVALLALSALFSAATVRLWQLPSLVDQAIQREAQITRQSALSAIEQEGARLDRRLASMEATGAREIAETRRVADERLAVATGEASAQIVGIRQDLNARMDGLRADLQPTLANAASITGHVNEASAILFRRDALPAQLLGLTAAAKVTLGQTATTMRSIQEATPQMLATVQQVGENVKATTDASTEASRNTAQVMANFARATKPLPTWARIGLAVAPPLAQVGASVATTLAITGQVGK